jgi:hypothetical protein
MTFQQLAQAFEQGPSGTDQFKVLYKGAFQLMKTDPANAALYFVIGVAAHSYVTNYEDQGVEPAVADEAKARLEGYNRRLVAALAGDAAQRLQAASAIATDYQWDVPNF